MLAGHAGSLPPAGFFDFIPPLILANSVRLQLLLDLRAKVKQFEERIGLSAQLACGHCRSGSNAGNYADVDALTLQSVNERRKIAIAGAENDVLNIFCEFKRIDG